jgi:hypothetical protein
MAPTGEIKAMLTLTELSFKDREGKVNAAALSGTYTPNAQGLEASGRIRIEADGVSEGQVLIKQTKQGERTEWKVLFALRFSRRRLDLQHLGKRCLAVHGR